MGNFICPCIQWRRIATPSHGIEAGMEDADSISKDEAAEDGEDHPIGRPLDHPLIDELKQFEAQSTLTLTELCLAIDSSSASDKVPSLAIQSLTSLLDADTEAFRGDSRSANERESDRILVETCQYLVKTLQDLYDQPVHPAARAALQKALSVRMPFLPDSERFAIDGCDTILSPPDTSGLKSPASVAKNVQDYLKGLKTIGGIMRKLSRYQDDNGNLLDGHGMREHPENDSTIFLLSAMFDGWSAQDCAIAFISPYWAGDQEEGLKEIKEDIETWTSSEASSRTSVCALAGILYALRDFADFHHRQKDDAGKSGGADGGENGSGEEQLAIDEDGHIIYEEDEPEMYHGWSGSWPVNEDAPKKNDFFFGVKLGTILKYAEEHAKVMAAKPLVGTRYSSPYARFHTDLSQVTIGEGEANPDFALDVEICRARHVEADDIFYGDSGAYSSSMWTHDGGIGFVHTGAGWKNRDFEGALYAFTANGITKQSFSHEFWETPREMLADSVNSTVWIRADERIKGFSIDEGFRFSTSYIFNLAGKKALKKASKHSGVSKRRKIIESKDAEHGRAHLMVLGSSHVAYLDRGYLQTWKLDEANRHDGVRRSVNVADIDNQIRRWSQDEVINWKDCCWMDETGSAEVSRGCKPDSLRPVDIVNPSSIGYLPNDRLAFANACYDGAHFSNGQIRIFDHDLREVSCLAGMSSDGIDIVHRPTFGSASLVASDASCVKIFDLRTGKPEMTIKQGGVKCATPIFADDGRFVFNNLYGGKGGMMWDVRQKKALYSLPIKADAVEWIPSWTEGGVRQPPKLIASNGEYYSFHDLWDVRDEDTRSFRESVAGSMWKELEKDGDKSGDCAIM